jgi:hypothetical protein
VGFHGASSSSLSLSLWLNIEILLLFFPITSRCFGYLLLLGREMGRGRTGGEGDGREHNEHRFAPSKE